jgi:hypothetical protein
VDDGKEFDPAAIDVQIRQFSQLAIAESIDADHQHPPVARRVLQQQANVGFDSPNLTSARIDRMNETKTMSGSSPVVAIWDLIFRHVRSRVTAIGLKNHWIKMGTSVEEGCGSMGYFND